MSIPEDLELIDAGAAKYKELKSYMEAANEKWRRYCLVVTEPYKRLSNPFHNPKYVEGWMKKSHVEKIKVIKQITTAMDKHEEKYMNEALKEEENE